MFKVGDIVKRVADPWGHAAESNTPIGVARRVSHSDGRYFWVEGGPLPGTGGGCDPRWFELVPAAAPASGESDPTGRDAHSPGAKLDAGKNRPSLIIEGMARAIWAVSEVATFGAAKYTPGGWVLVPNGQERYADAGYRHTLKRAMGERNDPDSEKLHLAHEAWNALAKLDLYLREQEKANNT